MMPISHQYHLKIRQEPERARVTGAKEKDRKPVDPPPIIQLHIRDASDPAQNYLQSPYYFMCCNLWHAEKDEAIPTDKGSVLAGTLVSSLHRLKDADNTDGGFFVFGDLSVKLEGEYRLKFSLFEMFRTEVIYLQAIVSKPFVVHSAKNFPGMAESTFLSRSFGDQGVRLRIRKESRISKRPPPSTLRHDDCRQQYQQQAFTTTGSMSFAPSTSFAPNPMREYTADYSEQPNKRQRTSISNSAEPYVRDQATYTSRPTFFQAQPTYDMYSAQAFTQATGYPTQSAITAPATFPVRFNFNEAVSTASPPDSSSLAYAMAPSTLPQQHQQQQHQAALYQTSPQQQRTSRYYPPTTTAYGIGTPQFTDVSQIPPAPRMSHGQPNHFRSSNSSDSLQSPTSFALSSSSESLPQQQQPQQQQQQQQSIQPLSNTPRRNTLSQGSDYSQFPSQFQPQQQQQHQHQQQLNQNMHHALHTQAQTPTTQTHLGLRGGDSSAGSAAGYTPMLPPLGSSNMVTTLDGSTGMVVTSEGFGFGGGGLGLEEG